MIFGTRYKMESWGAYSETIKDVKTMTAEKWDCTGGNSGSQPPFQIITDGSYHHLTSYILHLTSNLHLRLTLPAGFPIPT